MYHQLHLTITTTKSFCVRAITKKVVLEKADVNSALGFFHVLLGEVGSKQETVTYNNINMKHDDYIFFKSNSSTIMDFFRKKSNNLFSTIKTIDKKF